MAEVISRSSVFSPFGGFGHPLHHVGDGAEIAAVPGRRGVIGGHWLIAPCSPLGISFHMGVGARAHGDVAAPCLSA